MSITSPRYFTEEQLEKLRGGLTAEEFGGNSSASGAHKLP
jgi:hypothetical protein